MYEKVLNKIITLNESRTILDDRFRLEHRIVFTNGCFDILHRGHIYYLSKAREKGDLLIVGLNSDDSVKRLKGTGRPVTDQQSRAEILAALECVDYVIIFEEDTPVQLIKELLPDILVKGGDYKIEDIVGYDEVTSAGGHVETIPFLEGYSSTQLISGLK